MASPDAQQVARALREMSLLLQVHGDSGFKTRAYDAAADRVAPLTDLAERVRAGTLTELPGIGESIGKKIEELVTTGTLRALEELKQGLPPRFLELLDVPDLGPKKAKHLFDALGVGSVEELEAACRAGKVRALKGFGAKSEEKLLRGVEVLRRASAGPGRRLLAQVLPRAEAALAWVQAAPGVKRAALGGSVRRGRETVADVDLIVSAKDPEPVFDRFVSWPEVREVLGRGGTKAAVRLQDGDLQVDLRVVPDVDFATALHHFTGSKAHHIKLRGLALERGLSISEWGVFRGEEKLKVPTEDALYALLDLQPVPPELREDQGEIEAARAHRLPTDLVALEDLRGNVHAHSTWSDGRDTLLDLAKAAKALGLSYLTVTEHSQTAGYAGGLTRDRLQAQWEEIARVQEQVKGLTLLRGIESDILEDGRLDYPDEVLAQLDVVICSIHQRHGQDEAQMTRRVLAALDNPHFMIWGHPTGRLLGKREPAPLRMEEILDKAARVGAAVEINGCPERLDLKPEHVRLALDRGVPLVLSTDAHSAAELRAHAPLAVTCARRGWARRGDVLNTRARSGFLKALRGGGRH